MRGIERRIEKIEEAIQEPPVCGLILVDPTDDGSVALGEAIEPHETRAFTEPFPSDPFRLVSFSPRIRGWICQNWSCIVPEMQQFILEHAQKEKELRFLRALEREGVELPEQ